MICKSKMIKSIFFPVVKSYKRASLISEKDLRIKKLQEENKLLGDALLKMKETLNHTRTEQKIYPALEITKQFKRFVTVFLYMRL